MKLNNASFAMYLMSASSHAVVEDAEVAGQTEPAFHLGKGTHSPDVPR